MNRKQEFCTANCGRAERGAWVLFAAVRKPSLEVVRVGSYIILERCADCGRAVVRVTLRAILGVFLLGAMAFRRSSISRDAR